MISAWWGILMLNGVGVGLTVGLLVNSLSAMGRGDALSSYQILCWKPPIRSPKELTVVHASRIQYQRRKLPRRPGFEMAAGVPLYPVLRSKFDAYKPNDSHSTPHPQTLGAW